MMVILRILNLYCTILKPVEDDEIDKKKTPKISKQKEKKNRQKKKKWMIQLKLGKLGWDMHGLLLRNSSYAIFLVLFSLGL